LTNTIFEKVGYYKYEPSNPLLVECVREYPITQEILEYLKKTNSIKFELENNKPKLIDGKMVVLI
jgi:hypothetical protein